jgi:hypothetical protein
MQDGRKSQRKDRRETRLASAHLCASTDYMFESKNLPRVGRTSPLSKLKYRLTGTLLILEAKPLR